MLQHTAPHRDKGGIMSSIIMCAPTSSAQPQEVIWPWLLTKHLPLDLYNARFSWELFIALMPPK